MIDFQSGWCVGNLGWSRPEIDRALRDFDEPAYVYPGHRYAPWGELARALVEISPSGLRRCFRATGGSEAVEIAMQAAMLHTGRARFVTIEDCYHGNTLGPRSISDSETRGLFPRLRQPDSTEINDHVIVANRAPASANHQATSANDQAPVVSALGKLIAASKDQLARIAGTTSDRVTILIEV